MNTENTEMIRGYVFYDAHCPLCRRWVGRGHGLLARRGLHAVPLQAGWARKLLGLKEDDPLVEMKVIVGGRVHGGADALMEIARRIWWAWPLFIVGQVPGVKAMLRKAYVRLAAKRPCDDGRCEVLEHKAREHRHVISKFYEMP